MIEIGMNLFGILDVCEWA